MALQARPDRTKEEAVAMFHQIEDDFPHTTVGDDRWWLLVIPPLVYSHPHHVATLYTYLLSRPSMLTPESRRAFTRRLRECLLESVPILGVVRVLEALMAVVAVEAPADQDHSFSRSDYQRDAAHARRGDGWLEALYTSDLPRIDALFAAHKDFLFINHEITYGLYLSDMRILDPVETELLVLSGIMVQGAQSPTGWHLKGMRRIGMAVDDVQRVQDCVRMFVRMLEPMLIASQIINVATFCGVYMGGLPRATDVEA